MRTRPTDAEDLVEPQFACPRCGERSMELLTWDVDGETITCHECGCEYDPMGRPDPNEAEAERLADDAVEQALAIKERHEEDARWEGVRPMHLSATRMFEMEADRAENAAHDSGR